MHATTKTTIETTIIIIIEILKTKSSNSQFRHASHTTTIERIHNTTASLTAVNPPNAPVKGTLLTVNAPENRVHYTI